MNKLLYIYVLLYQAVNVGFHTGMESGRVYF